MSTQLNELVTVETEILGIHWRGQIQEVLNSAKTVFKLLVSCAVFGTLFWGYNNILSTIWHKQCCQRTENYTFHLPFQTFHFFCQWSLYRRFTQGNIHSSVHTVLYHSSMHTVLSLLSFTIQNHSISCQENFMLVLRFRLVCLKTNIVLAWTIV